MKAFALLLLTATLTTAAPLIEHHEQRDLIVRSLQRRVDESARGNETHHFYFIRLKPGDDWVYWPEGHLLWKTPLDPYYERKGPGEIRARAVWDLRLYCPQKPIDLEHDVVTDESELHPLDWRVTKDFVQRMIAACTTRGEMISVRRQKSE